MLNRSAVVAIGVDRHGVGSDNSCLRGLPRAVREKLCETSDRGCETAYPGRQKTVPRCFISGLRMSEDPPIKFPKSTYIRFRRVRSPGIRPIGDHRKLVGELGAASPVAANRSRVRLRMPYTSNIPMLPQGQPHAEHHLGGAKNPHPIRLLDEPHGDPTGTLRADYPKARMLLRSQELYEPIPERDYRESLYKPPLPHGALLPFSCRTTSPLIVQLCTGGAPRTSP